jgi:hypothetical protein
MIEKPILDIFTAEKAEDTQRAQIFDAPYSL